MRARQVREVVAAALRARRKFGVSASEPVCPIALARGLGLSVRYVSAGSLEGLYRPGHRPLVILGSQRPWGRRNYTCAHEIGHHTFGHGARVDEVAPEGGRNRWDPEEYMADRFASALLMPKLAVTSAFTCRSMSYANPKASNIALVAGELGVGYRTLIGCMERTLNLIDAGQAKALRRRTPKSLQQEVLGPFETTRLVQVDQHWRRPTVDLEIGEVVLLPVGVSVDATALRAGPVAGSYVAVATGIARVGLPGASTPLEVRVSRRWFHGLEQYRFLEEDDHE